MRFNFFKIVFCFLVLGCVKKQLAKPEKLISKPVMEQILYDMAILNATRNTGVEVLRDNQLLPEVYVYEKYKIDSTQFAESTRYYASEPEAFAILYANVETRLKKLKDSLEQTSRPTGKQILPTGNKDTKKIKDSLGKKLSEKKELIKN